MGKFNLLLDTDVVINWLAKEVSVEIELWKASYEIIREVEQGKIRGFLSLFSLLEVRFVLRRKKKFSNEKIEKLINDISEIFEITIPDEIVLLRANRLQMENKMDPFDAILLSLAILLKPIRLITRDKEFRSIANLYVDALTPEDFLKDYIQKEKG